MADPATVFHYLDDAVERPFLVTALSRTLTDAERERYAAAIVSRDPVRAEWLRLERELHARAAGAPGTRRRFDALCEALQCDWVRLLRRDMLLNCGRAIGAPRPARFTFVCERRWESLLPTEDPRVRACDSCDRRVYFCDRVPQAEVRVREGECIAMPSELVAQAHGGTFQARHVLGRPNLIGGWAAELFPGEGRHGRRSS